MTPETGPGRPAPGRRRTVTTMKFGARTDPFGSRRTMIVFTLAAGVAAVGIGLVGGAFRWCLERAGELRGELLVWAHTLGPAGAIVPVSFVAACALIGRIFARITPRASGSGIQDVEAVWHEEEELPGPAVLPARFLGGVIAIGSGMVMGREGPTVHLGATIGADIGRWFRLSDYERKLLYTTVGGAGLAVAFNAPIGGALFTIEEVTRSFRVRVVLITLVTTSVAVGVSRYLVPGGAIFTVPPIATPGFVGLWPYLLFGLLTAPLGVAYNALTMGLLRHTDRMHVRATIRATLIGAIIGAVLWFDPLMVGGGESLTQLQLAGHPFALLTLLALLAVRFLLGPLSYATGAPGGLFAPLLAIGALWGAVFHDMLVAIGGPAAVALLGASPVPFALVGMVAFFTATVRAPLTGIVLIVEMTATTTLITEMFIATAGALFVAALLNAPPIYDSLRDRMLARRGSHGPVAGAKQSSR